MNKAKFASLCINATLCLPGLISAQDIQVDLDKMRDFNAVQTIYRNGVLHTDKQGNRFMKYDPEKSFFQVSIWGNLFGNAYGYEYDLKVLTDASVNTSFTDRFEPFDVYVYRIMQMDKPAASAKKSDM